MTDILLVCGKDGRFKSCRACGHASFAKKGTDIVCAAETIVLRTSVELLSQTEGVVLSLNDSVRGFLEFRVEEFRFSARAEERLKCIGDFIRLSLQGLSAEYPENVHFQEISEE